MKKEYKLFRSASQTVLNLIFIIGTFSVPMYTAGYFAYHSFYATLGIKSNFLDFQYYDYLINGIRENHFFFVLIFAFVLPWLFFLYKINSFKSEAMALNFRGNLSKKDRTKLDKLISEIGNIERDLKQGWFQKTSFYTVYKMVFVFFLLLLPLFYFLKYTTVFFLLVSIEIQLSALFFILFLLSKTDKVKHIQLTVIQIIPILFSIIVIIMPAISGYIHAKEKLISQDFDVYNVTTNRSKFDKAKFVYFGKNNYFFLIDEKLTLIPQAEIVLLQKN